MRTLLLPDIHQDLPWADAVLTKHAHDRLVCLGDYFDSFTPQASVTETAEWLIRRYKEYGDRATFLIGNHDLPYLEYSAKADKNGEKFYNGRITQQCSGYTDNKAYDIHRVFRKREDDLRLWDILKPYTWVDGLLLTHAGWHPYHQTNQAYNEFFGCPPSTHQLSLRPVDYEVTLCGHSRGGDVPFGGLFWNDHGDLWCMRNGRLGASPEDDNRYNQICGHTRHRGTARLTCYTNGTFNLCLDGGEQCFAILDDQAQTIEIRSEGGDRHELVIERPGQPTEPRQAASGYALTIDYQPTSKTDKDRN